MDMTGGEALARSPAANGVSHIFGIPGVQLDHAADALYHATGSWPPRWPPATPWC
ncbi:hypothetical protein [Streptosporangium pseudovulgare]|uniref:Thiamine pyrophosphate enzyme N-terminal TPP-binding domain-containing protein n=1 Tax=Streptosporangium pseudovulgare TaxID=35765 RepID=A0ABQ2RC81_9ACTN|nr:hypothetical protein [Streptosporangium pseudovulgare]GGQ18506.1 hypothetical protein GCM10010140_56190 [Streptosporangium pseudovulgare]